MRTINRNPFTVNSPSSSEIKDYFFTQSKWNGINDDKNFLNIDGETFEDCNNIYVDSEGLLRSRPALKIRNIAYSNIVLNTILNIWTFGSVTVYLSTESDNRYLTFVNGSTVTQQLLNSTYSENIKLINADNRIFVFAEQSLHYFDIDDNTYNDGTSLVYIPITKVVDGIATRDLESSNILTTSYYTRYLYDNVTESNFSVLYGKNIVVTLDGNKYEITFKRNNELVFVGKYAGLSEYNLSDTHMLDKNNVPLVSMSESGTAIVGEYFKNSNLDGDYNMRIYYTATGLVFSKLPDLHQVFGVPKISKDGSFCAVFAQLSETDDYISLYGISLLEDDDGIKRYPIWTDLFAERNVQISSTDIREFMQIDNYINLIILGNNRNAISFGLVLLDYNNWSSTFPLKNTESKLVSTNSTDFIEYQTIYNITCFNNQIFRELLSGELFYNATYSGSSIISSQQYMHTYLAKGYPGTRTLIDDGLISSFTANVSTDYITLTSDITITLNGVEYEKIESGTNIGVNATEIHGKLLFSSVRNSTTGLISLTISIFSFTNAYKYYGMFDMDMSIFSDCCSIAISSQSISYGTKTISLDQLRVSNPYKNDTMFNYVLYKNSSDTFIHLVNSKNINPVQSQAANCYILSCKSIANLSSLTEISLYNTCAIKTSNNNLELYVFNNKYDLLTLTVTTSTSGNTISFSTDDTIQFARLDLIDGTNLSENMTILTKDRLRIYGNNIPLLFSAQPVDVIDNAVFLADTNYLYSNISTKDVTADVLTEGEYNFFVPDFDSKLEDYYFAKGKKLFISSGEFQLNSDEFKWYLPEIRMQEFDYEITNLHPISSTEMAIFLSDSVYYSAYDSENNAFYFYKSKLQVGCNKGCDVLTTFDGKYIIFTSKRGLVAMSYQEFVATTEQALTYLSDTIYDKFKTFMTETTSANEIKLFKFGFWILIYKQDSINCFIFDLRNNSWWYETGIRNITKFYEYNNIVRLLSGNKIYDIYKQDVNYFDFDDTQHKIKWSLKSQKLYLADINRYKEVKSLTFTSVHDMTNLLSNTQNVDDADFILKTYCYRKQVNGPADDNDYTSVSYNVTLARTYVVRMNLPKVNEFQFELSNENLSPLAIPLSLNSITIKYKIGGQVR